MTNRDKPAAAHVLIRGRVQGVGFRFFAQDAAETHGLKGWVRNLPGGNVELEVEGPRSAFLLFVEASRRDSVDFCLVRTASVRRSAHRFPGQFWPSSARFSEP